MSTVSLFFVLTSIVLLLPNMAASGHGKRIAVEVSLQKASIIHVWMRAKQTNKLATLSILRSPVKLATSPIHWTKVTEWFEFKALKPNKIGVNDYQPGNYWLSWSEDTTEMSYLYVYEPKTVKEDGIRCAYIREEARHHPDLHSHSFHLRTALGWNNEPNGFTRTSEGLYHVFYQHVPNQAKPVLIGKIGETIEAMHWGHVVSTDLANWVHMPVFLVPKYEPMPEEHTEAHSKHSWVEQWFSGSAMPMLEEDKNHKRGGLRVFVTSFQAGRKPSLATQKEMHSEDGISVNQERVIVDDFPKNPSYEGKAMKLKEFNFRDPNVFQGPGGFYYMTLGTEDTISKGGAILLYRTTEPNNLDSSWEYRSILRADNRDGFGNIECPGLFPLGDYRDEQNTLYALVYAREWGNEDNQPHRARDMLITLGHFDGEQFMKLASEQSLDFAYGSYGHQGIYEPQSKQAMMMGWLAIWNNWDMKTDMFSSQTLPRIIRVAPKKTNGSWNGVLIGPNPEVVNALKGPKMEAEKTEQGEWKFKFAPGQKTAYLKLHIEQANIENGQTELYVNIEHKMYTKLGVRISTQGGLELVKQIAEPAGEGVYWRGEEHPEDRRPQAAKGARPDIVHVFIDIDSLEVYGELVSDEGTPRWVGTTRLVGNGDASVRGVYIEQHGAHGLVKQVEAWQMQPTEVKGGHMNMAAIREYGGSGVAEEKQQKIPNNALDEALREQPEKKVKL